MFDLQASRAIDVPFGLTLIHADGSAEPFHPPDGRHFPTLESIVDDLDVAIERTFGLSPRYRAFWNAAASILATSVAFVCCCVVAWRRRWCCCFCCCSGDSCCRGNTTRPKSRHSRTRPSGQSGRSAWGYVGGTADGATDQLFGEDDGDDDGDGGEPEWSRPCFRVVGMAGDNDAAAAAALGAALGEGSAVAALEHAARAVALGGSQGNGSAVAELSRITALNHSSTEQQQLLHL